MTLVPANQVVTPAAIAPSTSMVNDAGRFRHMMQVADTFARSQLVPQHLRGKPADCLLALHIADRMGEDPLTVMQSIYVVSGRAGWAATYMIARANRSGVFKGRISWRTDGKGDSLAVTAYATMADTGEVVEATVSMAMAKAEGWTKNPKYQSLGDQMLKYRAATFLIRLYCPEVMLGYPAVDEIEDMAAAAPPVHAGPARVIDPEVDPFERAADEVVEAEPATVRENRTVEADPALSTEADEAAARGTGAYAAFWTRLTREQRTALLPGHEDRKAAAAQADAAEGGAG